MYHGKNSIDGLRRVLVASCGRKTVKNGIFVFVGIFLATKKVICIICNIRFGTGFDIASQTSRFEHTGRADFDGLLL